MERLHQDPCFLSAAACARSLPLKGRQKAAKVRPERRMKDTVLIQLLSVTGERKTERQREKAHVHYGNRGTNVDPTVIKDLKLPLRPSRTQPRRFS